MNGDAVDLLALVPAGPIAVKGHAARMARHAGDHVDLVPRFHPFAAVFVRPVGRRVDFRREVVRQKQNSHMARQRNSSHHFIVARLRNDAVAVRQARVCSRPNSG